MRLQRVLVAVLAAIMTTLTVYTVAGQRYAYGPVFAQIGASHGLHVSDLPVIGLWVVAMIACATLWVRPPAE